MQPGERWEPGDLVQIKRGVEGKGDIGVVVGETVWRATGGRTVTLDLVLFSDGVREVHPGNLQKPDGRTRPRR